MKIQDTCNYTFSDAAAFINGTLLTGALSFENIVVSWPVDLVMMPRSPWRYSCVNYTLI